MALSGLNSVEVTDTSYGQIVTVATDLSEENASTEEIVRQYFSDIPVMIQVARCESHFRHTLADGTVLRGVVDNRDLGVMQINTYYHGEQAKNLELNLENIYDNMAYARDLYERQGTQPWSASAPCWSRTLASL